MFRLRLPTGMRMVAEDGPEAVEVLFVRRLHDVPETDGNRVTVST